MHVEAERGGRRVIGQLARFAAHLGKREAVAANSRGTAISR
jgi:hypothetical protein